MPTASQSRAERTLIDDLGIPVTLPTRPRRVVSLVPSLTETIASVAQESLVGATDWCTHPPDLQVTRVRGTKNPDRQLIRQLRPDLVVANREENRQLDVTRLREAGVPVWVTDIETVPAALDALYRLLDVLGVPAPAWLEESRRLWSGAPPAVVARVAVPIWRDPWMVVGGATFTSDLLRRAGLGNAFADEPGRYPHVDLARIDGAGADVVLLPDEPYAFTADDGPEAFERTPTRLVDGRLLTWYGPSLVQAHATVSALARDVTP